MYYTQEKPKTVKRLAQLGKAQRLARKRARPSEFMQKARAVDHAEMMRKEALRERRLDA